MAKAVVVDNNPQELQQTVKKLKESDLFIEIIPFEDSLEAVLYIERYGCDVVFSEVEMKALNGFDIIRILNSHLYDICFIFLTNKDNYALQAFEYDAADFIVKPIDKEGIRRVAKKLQE